MLIKYVKLSNIRSYISEKVDFPRGSVLLSGDIGSGKSTILLAIEFCLFGIKRGDFSGSSILRHGKQQGFVEVCLEIDKKEFVIRRNLKASTTGIKQDAGYIIADGVKKELTASELRAFVLELLGYPKNLLSKTKDLIYRYTVYTPQEEMKLILFEDKDTRIEILRKVFGIDKYKTVTDNVSVYLRELKRQNAYLAEDVKSIDEKQELLEKKKAEIKLAEKKLAGSQAMLAKKKAELCEKESELEIKEEAMKAMLEKKQELASSKLANQELEKQASRVADDISKLKLKISQTVTRISELHVSPNAVKREACEKAIAVLERELYSITARKAGLESQQKLLEKEVESGKQALAIREAKAKEIPSAEYIKRLETAVMGMEELQNSIAQKEALFYKISANCSKFQAGKESSEALLKQVSSLDTCPTCLQVVNENHKHRIAEEEREKLVNANNAILALQKQSDECNTSLQKAKAKADELNEKEKELSILKHKAETAEEAVEELVKMRDEAERRKAELEKVKHGLAMVTDEAVLGIRSKINQEQELLKKAREAELIQKEKESLEKMNTERVEESQKLSERLEALHNELKNAQAKITALESELKSLPIMERELLTLKAAFKVEKQNEREIEVYCATSQEQINGLSEFSRLLAEEVAAMADKKQKLLESEKTADWIETFFLNLVSVMEKHVLLNIHREFNEFFREWFNMLIEDQAMEARLDSDFTPSILQDGYEVDICDLSGGEKTACALAYRLALNRVINDLVSGIKTRDIIMLDEPTDGFSSEQLDRVREVLEKLRVKQTIIVSHESKIESFVENIIRVAKVDHESRIQEY